MKVKRLVVGNLQTNCFLAYDDSSKDCLIIDPGDDAEYIINVIRDLELKPVGIVATHAHYDHIIAVNELKMKFNIHFFLHKNDEKMLNWMRKSANYFGSEDSGPPPKVDKYIKEGNFKLKSINFKVIHTPGHSPGSISLYTKSNNMIFVGDVIFERGAVGRFDLPYSDKLRLDNSIKQLLSLPQSTIVHSGHGEATTIGKFRKYYD